MDLVEQQKGEALKAVCYVLGSEPKSEEVVAFVNGPMRSLLCR
ncbi:hypothetical protein HNR31_002512 [Anoxybacillus caldiproteolyticus]|uniref:Uncharacterized protein n=1 Tax=Thermaerobacillus caldiproteolyticus TaxID=247480 RepID=A0A7V9Z7Y6_9BACL|nr:hypothetical protein [Anoxybacillus caldiproteolyticus]